MSTLNNTHGFLYSSLKGKLDAYMNENFDKIEKAYIFAEKAHEGQNRKNGEPYITHPVETACILADVKADQETIIAALLHDTVEDTSVTLDQIKELFGENVAQLVDGVTKIKTSKLKDADDLDAQIESLRKWFDVMQLDVRVAVIKLADRLHNMRTLEGLNDHEKQLLIARATLGVHVKIADKLGVRVWRRQLEDLGLKYLDENNFQKLAHVREEQALFADSFHVKILHRLKAVCPDSNFTDLIYDAYTLFDLYQEGIHLHEHHLNVLPYRFYLIVPTERHCYEMLYYLHSLGRRKKMSYEDYVNTPAINGYRAVHTTLIFNDGTHVKFKIQTMEMHLNSQFGVTRTCFDNGGKDVLIPWMKHISDVTQEGKERSEVFWDGLQNDILDQSIVVHGPDDKVQLLPRLSTALDAAFYFLGHDAFRLESVVINGKDKPLYQDLIDADDIDFILGEEATVEYEWLNFVNTKFATSRIREGLQGEDRRAKIEAGKELMQVEMRERGHGLLEELRKSEMEKLIIIYSLNDIDELYVKLAAGFLDAGEVCEKLFQTNPKKKKNVPKKDVVVKGSLEKISEFLSIIPENFKNKLKCHMKPQGENVLLRFTLANLSISEWKNFLLLLKRQGEIETVSVSNSWAMKKDLILLLLVGLLWGFDPVAAKYILIHDVTPFALTAIRFWMVTFVFAVGLLFRKSFLDKGKYATLPLWNRHAFSLAALIFGVAFATYTGLQEAPPSYYLLTLGFFPILTLVFAVCQLKAGKCFWAIFSGVISIGALISLLILVPNTQWSIESRAWVVMASILFTAYSFYVSYVQRRFKVVIRYNHLQLLLAVYCSLFALIIMQFVTWPRLDLTDYLIAGVFAVIFTGIPHLIFFYFIKKIATPASFVTKLTMIAIVVFGLVMISESYIFGIDQDLFKIPFIIIGSVGLGLLLGLYQKISGKFSRVKPLI